MDMEAALAAQAAAGGGLSYSVVRPTAFFKSVSGQLEVVAGGAPFVCVGKPLSPLSPPRILGV